MRFSGFKRLLCGFAAVLSLYASCAGADAMNPSRDGTFPDVPYHDDRFEAVEYLHDNGITNGLSDFTFGVDELISGRALCAFASRAFLSGQELVSRPGFAGEYAAMVKAGYVPGSVTPSGPVSFTDGVVTICRAAGIIPVGAGIESKYTKAAAYRYIRDVAREMGIMDLSGSEASGSMTRGDAAYVVYSVRKWLESGDAGSGAGLYGFGYIDIDATEDYEKFLPELHVSLFCVPFRVLRSFHNMGFRVEVDDTHIDEYNAKRNDGAKAVALFSAGKKTIWTVVGHSLPHEFGHFTQFVVMNDRVGVKPVYEAEKDHLSKHVSVYAKVNSDEFFAEVFSTMAEGQDDQVLLDELKSAMPLTYGYFESLKATNWTVVRASRPK